MSDREQVDSVIVFGREGLEVTTVEQAYLVWQPMKRSHADAILVKLEADGIEAHIVSAFGPGAES